MAFMCTEDFSDISVKIVVFARKRIKFTFIKNFDYSKPLPRRIEPSLDSLKIFSVRFYVVQGVTSNAMRRLSPHSKLFLQRAQELEDQFCRMAQMLDVYHVPSIGIASYYVNDVLFSTVHLLSMVTP